MSSMAKQNAASDSQGGFLSELLRFGLYKPNQGRVVRQLTFVGSVILSLLTAYQISNMELWDWAFTKVGGKAFGNSAPWLMLVFLGAIAVWICFRAVNYPKFADFLIAVEAEMNKVSWPSKQELWRASLVVIFVIFAMAGVLFLFDVIWTYVFELVGVRYSPKG